MNPIPVKALVAASLVAAGTLQASTINWASTLNRTNLTSTGATMDASFRFELGVFKGGFVPTRENTDQWLANWVPAQRTPYNANTRWFTTNFVVTSNASPFTLGAKGYVWGFGEAATGGEWILFRATNWTWPAPNPESPVITSWTAKNANAVTLGDVQNSGAYHMRTEAVGSATGPAVTWNEWRAVELAAATSPNGTPADLNANGVQDVFDYALQRGANPNPGSWMRWHEADGKRHLEVRIPRRRDRPAAFVVEVSADLQTWTSGSTVTEVVEDSASALVVRDKTPVGEGGDRRFLRVRTIAGA
ncbi:MAG: hypothetical protein IAE97_14725 [Chthoniobacterales bacterium]|nr:hypothetical protein [Chthoniobacterales bacterium]